VQSDIMKLEERFQELQSETPTKQWSNAAALRRLALSLEANDLPLAYRVAQRAHNLNPNAPRIKFMLKEYRAKLKNSFPELLSYSSSENKIQDKSVDSQAKIIVSAALSAKPPPAPIPIPVLEAFLSPVASRKFV